MELGQVALIIVFCCVLLLMVFGIVKRFIMPESSGESVGAIEAIEDPHAGVYLYLVLYGPLDQILDKKQVTLDVKIIEKTISQK